MTTAGSSARGCVLRLRREDLKPPSQTFILLIDDDPLGEDEALRWFSESAILVGRRDFELDGGWVEALLYFELIRPEGRRATDFEPVRPGAPSEIFAVDPADSVGVEAFQRFVELADDSLRSRDADALAESLSQFLPASKIPGLWAATTAMADALAVADPPYPPGTDSFQYWATAVIWGPRERYLTAAAGGRVEVTDQEEGFAEQLLDVPRKAYLISSGENVAFVRMGGAMRRPTDGVEPSQELVGVYFDVDMPGGILECVGMVVTADRGRLQSVAREFAERCAAGLGGVLRTKPLWAELGTMSMFSGMEIVSISERAS